jgi:hypothetical protein
MPVSSHPSTTPVAVRNRSTPRRVSSNFIDSALGIPASSISSGVRGNGRQSLAPLGYNFLG